jgi:hypothetical protein
MTCREFEHHSASLTLSQLARAQDPQILGHAGECKKCAAWLQQQRMLAATMQPLQARTAGCAAGPDVEQALLLAFRQKPSQPVQPEMDRRLTPIAMGLSQFFEIGAYVAVAAAILVGLFLGVQLLEKRSMNRPAESQLVQPSASSPGVAADKSVASLQQPLVVSRGNVKRLRARHAASAGQSQPDTVEPAQAGTDADYIALMLCDPLSCSSDTQVVRLELPGPGITGSGGAQDAQMRIADVVVGYDGVVRAVRIVN